MSHPQGQNRVGSGLDRNVLIGGLGGAGANRVDHHNPSTVAFSGFGDEMPMMMRGCQQVGAPNEDQLSVDDLLGVETSRVAFVSQRIPRLRTNTADRTGCSQYMKEPT
jgi:hypothetical protein